MSKKPEFIDDELQKRKISQQFRSLTPITPRPDGVTVERNGKTYINFCGNDYLGLATHPQVIERSRRYLENYGAGATASRLISGTMDIHQRLESEIARLYGAEAALLFNSGFQANSTLLGTLTDRHSLIIADKKSHNSLLQGALSSRASFQRFRHNDTSHLRELLEAAGDQFNRIWIATESVFSMDGDRSPLEEIAGIAGRFGAYLYVDDAHAVGVWGDDGLGLARGIGDVDLLLGTCGKACGSFGAYVTCSEAMRDYLVNFCAGFIYTTALPPAVVGATEAALQLIPTLNDERAAYHANIEVLRRQLQKAGFDTGPSTTQIIPAIVGSEAQTLALSEYLEKHGILATAIRPPTVPPGGSRIRFTLSRNHSEKQIDDLIKVLNKWDK